MSVHVAPHHMGMGWSSWDPGPYMGCWALHGDGMVLLGSWTLHGLLGTTWGWDGPLGILDPTWAVGHYMGMGWDGPLGVLDPTWAVGHYMGMGWSSWGPGPYMGCWALHGDGMVLLRGPGYVY